MGEGHVQKICNELSIYRFLKHIYLKAFIHESQRLLPAVSGMSRITQKDMVLAGYQIPEGKRKFSNSIAKSMNLVFLH